MAINSEIFIKCITPRNLAVETFVRIESRIIMLSNVSFRLEMIIYEALLTLNESLLALSHLSTPTSAINIVNVSIGCKNSCIVSTQNASDRRIYTHVIDIQKKSSGPNTDPCGTPNVMFDLR